MSSWYVSDCKPGNTHILILWIRFGIATGLEQKVILWCLKQGFFVSLTHPSWHNHWNGLNQTLQRDELVEAKHLACSHIQPVLWHHTCRREQRCVVTRPFWQHEMASKNSWLIGVTSRCCGLTALDKLVEIIKTHWGDMSIDLALFF